MTWLLLPSHMGRMSHIVHIGPGSHTLPHYRGVPSCFALARQTSNVWTHQHRHLPFWWLFSGSAVIFRLHALQYCVSPAIHRLCRSFTLAVQPTPWSPKKAGRKANTRHRPPHLVSIIYGKRTGDICLSHSHRLALQLACIYSVRHLFNKFSVFLGHRLAYSQLCNTVLSEPYEQLRHPLFAPAWTKHEPN